MKKWIAGIALAAAPLAGWSGDAGVSPAEIRIGTSAVLSGPLGSQTREYVVGSQLYFDAVNAQGGVHGRKIVYQAVDDGFDVKRAMAKLGPKADLDFSGYVYDRTELHEVDYNWKTFIEVYLEDYHVGPFHPGLGNFVTCDDLRWEFGREYSVQTVGVAGALGKAGSDIYRKWHDEVLRYQAGKPPKHGAIWLTLYPNVMVEWYPNVLVVSTLYPRGPQKTLNVVEFFYPEEIQAFEREFVEAQQAAYMETCVEDDEIALRMDAGRKALFQRGDNEVGPYQSPMEDGMQHFHEWYREVMGPNVPRR